MATHVGDIFIDAKLNTKEYDNGLKKMNSSASKIGSAIGKKIGMALSVAGLTKFIKDTTAAGASLNAMNAIVEAALPNMTKQVDEFAKAAGRSFGLSETQAKGFVGKFASMAIAMGYTEEEAYKMSTALTALAGDIASYYHIGVDEAYGKLGAIFTGETEALKSLGIIMTQSALDAYALEHGYGRVTAQMTELEKTTLRYNFVLDHMKLVSGDFAKYAYTWSGSIATIKLNWANFMATVGQGMINILLPLLQLIARISQALTALGSRFVAWTKRVRGIKDTVASATGKKTQNDLKKSASGIGNVGKGIGGAGKKAKGAKKAVQALKRELLGFDKITKLTGEQGTSSGGAGTSGGGGGLGDLGGLGDIELDEYDLGILEQATDYLANLKIPDTLLAALGRLKEALMSLFETLKQFGKWALDEVLIPFAKWAVNSGLPAAIDVLAASINLLTANLKIWGETLKPLWNDILKPFFGWWLEQNSKQFEVIANVINLLANAIDNLREKIEKMREIGSNISIKLDDKFSAVWDKIKSGWDSLKSKTVTCAVSLSDKFTAAWKKIKSAWNAIKSKTATISIGFKETLKSKWNTLARKVNSARAKAPAIIKNILPKMPILAQGGYVKANTPTLAMIGDNKHEGEVVAPESKLRAMAKEASSNPQMIVLLTAILQAINSLDTNVYLDGEAIKNNTVRRINNHTRATGQLELII